MVFRFCPAVLRWREGATDHNCRAGLENNNRDSNSTAKCVSVGLLHRAAINDTP